MSNGNGCLRFEEFGWKEGVHAVTRTIKIDRTAAHAAVLTDDGLSLGILFKDHRTVNPLRHVTESSIDESENGFAVGK